jgi:hypothetical protein
MRSAVLAKLGLHLLIDPLGEGGLDAALGEDGQVGHGGSRCYQPLMRGQTAITLSEPSTTK